MEQFKKVLHRILFPGGKAMICLVIASAALLTCVFVFDFRYNPFAYLSYILSAYTLTVCRRSSARSASNAYFASH